MNELRHVDTLGHLWGFDAALNQALTSLDELMDNFGPNHPFAPVQKVIEDPQQLLRNVTVSLREIGADAVKLYRPMLEDVERVERYSCSLHESGGFQIVEVLCRAASRKIRLLFIVREEMSKFRIDDIVRATYDASSERKV